MPFLAPGRLVVIGAFVVATQCTRIPQPLAPAANVTVQLSLCQEGAHYTVSGKRTEIAPQKAVASAIEEIAADLKAARVSRIELRSECKLTVKGVCEYCTEFRARGIDVVSLWIPSAVTVEGRTIRCESMHCPGGAELP